jgi:hypothetical protein
MRRIFLDFENHPINPKNSHVYCPYPFEDCLTESGMRNVFDHHLIKRLCRTDEEWNSFMTHAEQYMFPGLTLMRCPQTVYNGSICNSFLMIEHELFDKPVGELIVECTQNVACQKRFCYYCKKIITFYNICHDCKLSYENENPNVLNYYLNKFTDSCTEESDYLYLNKEVTVDIAVEQITRLLEDTNSFMICPICKIPLYKTEKCNGLSHHNLERCYSCGRIGFRIKGLGDHWNSQGLQGCFRFDHESYVKTYVPSYECHDNHCFNHEVGDCTMPDHQEGIQKLRECRKRSYVYHIFKSLSSKIRYNVYDIIFQKFGAGEQSEFLPFKQTFAIIDAFKSRTRDFSEEIVYQQLNLKHPSEIEVLSSKDCVIDASEYIQQYKIPEVSIEVPQIHITPAEDEINEENYNIRVERLLDIIMQEVARDTPEIEEIIIPEPIRETVITVNGYSLLYDSMSESEDSDE